MSPESRFAIFLCTVVLASCGTESEEARGLQPCSSEWFQLVEQRVSVGDAQGHGPDLGSSEWRSAVEFKLGIRGNPGIPDVATEQWCAYIDRELFRSAAP